MPLFFRVSTGGPTTGWRRLASAPARLSAACQQLLATIIDRVAVLRPAPGASRAAGSASSTPYRAAMEQARQALAAADWLAAAGAAARALSVRPSDPLAWRVLASARDAVATTHPALAARIDRQMVAATARRTAPTASGAAGLPGQVAGVAAPAVMVVGHRALAIVCLTLATVLIAGTGSVGGTWAYFTSAVAVGSNSFTTDTLPAPTNVNLSRSGSTITVSWTASTSYAVYDVYQSNGGAYAVAGSDQTGTSFDWTAPTSATYTFYVVAKAGTAWVSANSATAAITVDITPPTVSNFSPSAGTTGVSTASSVAIAFSKAMNQTATSAAVTLLPCTNSTCGTLNPAVSVSKTWDSTGSILTLTSSQDLDPDHPGNDLAQNTWYLMSVSTAAQDTAGNAFGAAATSSFQTGIFDSTPPTVSLAAPQPGATGVGTNSKVSLTFSKGMNTSAAKTAFSLKPCTDNSSSCTSVGSAVTTTAAWNLSNTVLDETPSALLTASQWYKVTAAATAADTGGNTLSGAVSWLFQTGLAADTTPPTVISVSPTPGGSGIALSQSVVVTFSKAMETAATTSAVTICTTGGSPTCLSGLSTTWDTTNTQLTLAHTSPSNTFATGTQYQVEVTTGAKDTAGNTMSAGGGACPAGDTTCGYLASFFTTSAAADTTPPQVTSVAPAAASSGVAVNVTLSMSFSEPMDTTATQSAFSLTGGNTGTLSYAWNSTNTALTISHSVPFATSTTYTATLSTAASDVAGMGLTNAITWSFTTGSSSTADTTAPTVASVSPANSATGVALSAPITITFSEPMNTAAAQSAVSICQTSATPVTPTCLTTVSYAWDAANSALTINHPNQNFAGNSLQYRVKITTSATDLAGNAMTAAGAAACPAGDGSCASAILFTTTATADITPPQVSSVSPANTAGQTNGPPAPATNAPITVTFSKAMNTTATESAFTLSPALSSNTYSFAWDSTNTRVIVSHSANFANATSYTVSLSGAATDVAGNRLAGAAASSTTAFSWSFTSASAADTTTPAVIAPTTPSSGASSVATNTGIVVTFSKAMNQAAVQSAINLSCSPSGCTVPPTLSYSWNAAGTVATITPSVNLTSSVSGGTTYTYTVTITTAARDLISNPMTQDSTCGGASGCAYKWSFSTSTSGANTTAPSPPTITGPTVEVWTSNSSYVITGTNAAADLKLELWQDADASCVPDGSGLCAIQAANDILAGTQQLTGGLTSFSFIASLQSAAANRFLVRAIDSSGNVSAATAVSLIRQGDIQTNAGAQSTSVSNTSATVTLTFSGDNTPPAGLGTNNLNSAVVTWRASGGTYGTTCPTQSTGGTSGSCTMTRSTDSGGNGTGFSYVINGLTAGATYDVQTIITDADGFSSSSVGTISGTTDTQTASVTTSGGSQSGLVGSVSSAPSTAFASRAGQTVMLSSTMQTGSTGVQKAQFVISTTGGTQVQTSSCLAASPGSTVTYTWDGKNSSSAYLADGTYNWVVNAYVSNNCSSNSTGGSAQQVVISNVAAAAMAPDPATITLAPTQSTTITATVYNALNQVVPDGSSATVTWTARGSADNLDHTSWLSRYNSSSGVASSIIGTSYSGECSVSSGTGTACTKITVPSGTTLVQSIVITASINSQNPTTAAAMTITASTTINDPPVAPTGLAMSAATGGQVRFTWGASLDTRTVGYTLFLGTESGRFTTLLDAGASTSLLYAGATPGVTYYAVVRGYDLSGQLGDPSNQAVFTVPLPTATPTASPTASPTTTAIATATSTPTATGMPGTATATLAPSATGLTATPASTGTATPNGTATATPNGTATATPAGTATATPAGTAAATATGAATVAATPSPAATPAPSATVAVPTSTPNGTATAGASTTLTPTPTTVASATATTVASATATPTATTAPVTATTVPPTATATPVPPAATPVPATATPTPSATTAPAPTPTP